ncbi:MAG: hypothetical protein OIN89_09725 [Candidatus Methanoperedens sp.]|jgi:hypothetical protein|nr:hypothetical protein [Candidatus Methanoperedens sp.]
MKIWKREVNIISDDKIPKKKIAVVRCDIVSEACPGVGVMAGIVVLLSAVLFLQKKKDR